MKSKLCLTLILIILSTLSRAQNSDLKPIIKDEKLQDLTVSVYQGPSDMDAIIVIKNNTSNAEEIFKISTYIPSVNTIADLLFFEDFNFDGVKEILIQEGNPEQPDGLYIYDYSTLQAMNLFTGKFEFENKDESHMQNYVYTYRGTYTIDNNEKTIKLSGTCGAMCGHEETYKFIEEGESIAEGDVGKYKLVERREWNW